MKDHIVVAHVHVPKPRDSVVETELGEIKRDVATGRTISLPMKNHNVVDHVHVPKPRDSVVETELEQVERDVATGRAKSLPTVEHRHKVTRQHPHQPEEGR